MLTADYQLIATAVTDEIAVLAPVALPVFGLIMAIFVGIKLFKRFVKAG